MENFLSILKWVFVFILIFAAGRNKAKAWFGPSSELLGIPLFLLVWVYLYWLWGALFNLPNPFIAASLTFALTGLLLWTKKLPDERCDFLGWGFLTSFFILGLSIRAYSPFLDIAERLPDMMMFQSLANDSHFPPQDRWLSGVPLNYYYFGQLLFVPWMKLANIPAEVALNLATCTIWALIAGSSYAVIRMFEVPAIVGIGGGIASALLSNWEWIRQLFEKGWGNFFWWDSSRAIPKTITEFPFFSFLLGDFHAHFIALPWLSLTFGMIVAFRRKNFTPFFLFILALTLGVHYALNTWELPAIFLLFGLLSIPVWKKAWIPLLGALFLFLPFALQYERPISFIGWIPSELRSPIHLFLLHWGIFLFPILILAFHNPRKFFEKSNWVTEERILFLVTIFLILICELIHFDNLYGQELKRMNTVFKFYTIAWWGFSISVPLILWKEREIWFKRKWTKFYFYIFVFFSLVYPIFGTKGRLDRSPLVPTLNGIAHWEYQAPGEKELVHWILEYTHPTDIIFEAVGPAYQRFGRISALTGRATILGWDNHEAIWRKNGNKLVQERKEDIRLASEDTTGKKFKTLIDKYRLSWAIVGDLERKTYSPNLLDQITKYNREYSNQGVEIYRLQN